MCMVTTGLLLICFASLYTLYRFWTVDTPRMTLKVVKYLFMFALGDTLLALGMIITSLESDMVTSWTQIIAISVVLSGLSILIRELKPVHTRYPVQFAGLPLLLIPTFLLIDDSEVLKDLLNMFLQGGTVLVLILIAIAVTEGFRRLLQFSIAILLVTITFGIYWFIPEDGHVIRDYWPMPFTAAIILFGNSLPTMLKRQGV